MRENLPNLCGRWTQLLKSSPSQHLLLQCQAKRMLLWTMLCLSISNTIRTTLFGKIFAEYMMYTLAVHFKIQLELLAQQLHTHAYATFQSMSLRPSSTSRQSTLQNRIHLNSPIFTWHQYAHAA